MFVMSTKILTPFPKRRRAARSAAKPGRKSCRASWNWNIPSAPSTDRGGSRNDSRENRPWGEWETAGGLPAVPRSHWTSIGGHRGTTNARGPLARINGTWRPTTTDPRAARGRGPCFGRRRAVSSRERRAGRSTPCESGRRRRPPPAPRCPCRCTRGG
jgi:hypothetical protein